jgi:hypothetical protein
MGSGAALTRVTVNLTRKAVEALDQISASTGSSKTDSINRALQVYALVNEITDQKGRLTIVGPDGKPTQLLIL